MVTGMLVAAAAAAQASAPLATPAQLTVSAAPTEVWIEQGDLQQLNFDFMVLNGGREAFDLRRIELSVVDPSGKTVLRRDADTSGASPAIETVLPDRHFEAGAKGIFFNPFTTFAKGFPLDNLVYRLTFESAKGERIEREVRVRPRPWSASTALVLPVPGRLWAKHGHDILSHHRRWNPLHPIAQGFGATATFARYALDLMAVDSDGRTRKTGARRNDDYFGWGMPVLAPGSGTVVAAHDEDADDDLATGKSGFDPERLPKEPLHFYGNYVIIDHGHREYSLLGHLQQGSVSVKVGERVAQGQPIARMGTSGSAEFEPHLHYELRRGTTMAVEGVPAYFVNVVRKGTPGVAKSAPVNSGEFVSTAR